MVTLPDTAQVSLPADGVVSVQRAFKAPRELVYEAYTTPELLKKWLLGYPGWSMPVCEADVRVGGTYRWEFRSDEDGSRFGFHGEFLEVEAPGKIRHSETFDPGDVGGSMGDEPAMVSLTFEEHDGVTLLTTLIDYGSNAARDQALSTGMTDGMEASYAGLDALLAERSRG